jgi:hypothetical protein
MGTVLTFDIGQPLLSSSKVKFSGSVVQVGQVVQLHRSSRSVVQLFGPSFFRSVARSSRSSSVTSQVGQVVQSFVRSFILSFGRSVERTSCHA